MSSEANLKCQDVPIAMMSQRKGDWILTYTGVEFWPLDPRPEEIRIEDIAHALSMQCRYSGHVSQFYSVAEHCVRVAEIVPPKDRLWALLHDASEAYLVDLPRPIKRYTEIGKHYREAEERLMAVICERFGLAGPEPESVKRADQGMLCVEARELLPVNSWWRQWEPCLTGRERPIGGTFTPAQAEAAFLSCFYRPVPCYIAGCLCLKYDPTPETPNASVEQRAGERPNT